MKPYTIKTREGVSVSPMTSTRTVFNESGVDLDTLLAGKVEAVQGKRLSTNDYTDVDKAEVAKVADKLDKAAWDGEHEQFGISGQINSAGTIVSSSNYICSPFIPLNRKESLKLDVFLGTERYIAFYDANFQMIQSKIRTGRVVETIAVEDYPDNACYFVVVTLRKRDAGAVSYYHNGTTNEAREGAVSEAILASKLALFVDLWNMAAAPFGKYNQSTGFFELNELTDLTYEEAISIYEKFQWKGNCIQRSIDNTVQRTNLLNANVEDLFDSAIASPINLSYCIVDYHNKLKYLRVSSSDTYGIKVSTLVAFLYKGCENLEKVLGAIDVDLITGGVINFVSNQVSPTSLTTILFRKLNKKLNAERLPNISLESVSYWVANAINTSEITITVHPDVYAKLTNTDNLELAKSNLVLNSNVPVTGSHYPIEQYSLTEDLKAGEIFTITVWGTPSQGSNFLCVFINSKTEVILKEISSGVWQRTVTLNDDFSQSNKLGVYNYPNNNLEGTINKIKVCYGLDPNPQWSAPIDMPTDTESIEKINWSRVLLNATAKQITFATTN